MASRTDQLHSHQFTLQRVVSALAMRDPDPSSSPMRRIGGALLASVMLAALAVAAVGVYGVLRPGGDDSWRSGDAVIIEKETGARFVYRDGALHPVLNYSSALLILGAAQPKRVTVSRASLADVTRGSPLGIPGAPDLLPVGGELVTTAWTLCSGRPAGGVSGVESVLFIGSVPSAAPELLAERALLAVDPAGDLHLIWHKRRYVIRDEGVVLAAFTWTRQAAIRVAPAVLTAVPAGPDLARLSIPKGKKSTLDGYRVGQVFVVENQGGARQYAVAMPQGLADITQVQADLLLADPANPSSGAQPARLSQSVYASTQRAPSLILSGEIAPPVTTPDLAHPAAQGAVCTSFADGSAEPEVGTIASLLTGSGQIPTTHGAVGNRDVGVAGPTLDWVVVAPGRGAIVEALAGPGSPSGLLAIVSDLGVVHPVPSADVLAMLGYAGVRPQRLPASVVSLLPSGRVLDPAIARLPVAPA
jgi:type VII secretion protein EccB